MATIFSLLRWLERDTGTAAIVERIERKLGIGPTKHDLAARQVRRMAQSGLVSLTDLLEIVKEVVNEDDLYGTFPSRGKGRKRNVGYEWAFFTLQQEPDRTHQSVFEDYLEIFEPAVGPLEREAAWVRFERAMRYRQKKG